MPPLIMEEIFGYVERITYQNPENGYTVLQLKEAKKRDTTCVVGILPDAQPGETVRCWGTWKNHLTHGYQFEVKKYRTEAPADIVGIKKYLGSGLIRGIGPAYASRIVEKFGTDTLEIIDKTPEKLLDVSGLGEKRVEKIKACWSEQSVIREVMIFLQSHNISPSYSQKIFKAYGSQAVKIIQDNPFNLARDIHGIGFKTADAIAQNLKIPKDSPQRVDAAIEFLLSELSSEGHVCYPLEEFLSIAEKSLEIPNQFIQSRIEALKGEDRIVVDKVAFLSELIPCIWTKSLFLAEIGIAREVKRINRNHSTLREVDREKAIEWVQKNLNIQLAQNQKNAVSGALSSKLHIITGGPGTGKSTITNAILTICSKLTEKICLAAPTGRASKRMSEITGRKATTIHSLLEFDFKVGKFKKNRETPIDCDLMIIDEASMIDTLLMYHLMKAIPNHARVIFVGDINQLPSVGPGNVLKDMINSRQIPVSPLTEIFRQAAGSAIITNAHRINQGIFPTLSNRQNSDFFFIEANEPKLAIDEIINLVTCRLPKKYGFNSIQDIQVLSPMRRGPLGTLYLNQMLQESLNPGNAPLFRSGKKFLVGDKVMQMRNNYQKEVFNGDVGKIVHIDFPEQQMAVLIDDREVIYDFSDLDELDLAYAVTIHKYQGSEIPCAIIPFDTSHFKLLNRNSLYTGLTRGKKLVILVGKKKAIHIAVRNDEVKRRYTALKQALIL